MENYLNIITAFIFIISSFLLAKRLQKKDFYDNGKKKLRFILTVLAIFFISYPLFVEITIKKFYFFFPLALLTIFLISYKIEKRRLINGWLFTFFMISYFIYLSTLAFSTNNIVLLTFSLVISIAIILLFMIGLYGLIIFLYWNARVVRRKEQHSFANLLSLILAIVLTILLVLNRFSTFSFSYGLKTLYLVLSSLFMYFGLVFYNFLMLSFIYQLNRPSYTQDFILVLGSGLIEGQIVPPLLAQRIDKAIQFYSEQKKSTQHPLKIIMSGGKGSDELIAESVAMKKYALEKGIPEKDILVETHSTNTLENMKFSKQIMEKEYGNEHFKTIFVTNNFHLFRAGLLTKISHLKADGIGAKTAFYFLPNAFLREFIAIVVMKKKQHLFMCFLIIFIFLALFILNHYFAGLK